MLENHSLERNELEKESWDYESYNNYNLVERYWKKIIVFCLEKVGKRVISKKLTFINQIIYRMSCLKDNRHKKALINNFFKTYYFRNLRLNEYKVSPYDYHQLCFLFKYSPEVLLYCIDKFDEMSLFDKNKVKRFFEVRYEESLKAKFNEEQLYFYYAIKILDFEDILDKTKELVSISKNQVLISYYLMDNIFRTEEIEKLKAQKDEKYWFQSYHLILFNKELNNKLIDSIEDYLIPKEAKKDKQRKFYTEFYEANISAGRTIIRNIEKVKQEVIRYLNLKVAESKKRYKQKS